MENKKIKPKKLEKEVFNLQTKICKYNNTSFLKTYKENKIIDYINDLKNEFKSYNLYDFEIPEEYNSFDKKISLSRNLARGIAHIRNNLVNPLDENINKSLLELIIGNEIPEGSEVEKGLFELLGRVKLSKGVYIANGFEFHNSGDIYIGDNTMIGPNVFISSCTHPKNKDGISTIQKEKHKPIYIGDNNWLGKGVDIIYNGGIGNNTTIGTGSLVNKKLLKEGTYVGRPVKLLKNKE